MTDQLDVPVATDDELAATLERLQSEMNELRGQRWSERTRSSYTESWKAFNAFCRKHRLVSLPASAQTLGLFATEQVSRDLSPNTITARTSAIRAVHRDPSLVGAPVPVRPWPVPDGSMAEDVARAHRRRKALLGWKEHRADPLLLADLKVIRNKIKDPDTPEATRAIGTRDWAIMLLGFALGARRSELECLDITDLQLDGDWLLVRVCVSKTDQSGEGTIVQIPRADDHTLCPVAAVLAWVRWLDMKGIQTGPLFRSLQGLGTDLTVHGRATRPGALSGRLSGQAIGKRFTAWAIRAGVAKARITAHSGRSGAATQAYMFGATPLEISQQYRWKNNSDAMWRYLRLVDQRTNNATRKTFQHQDGS